MTERAAPTPPETWRSTIELAAELGVSVGTVKHWERVGFLPRAAGTKRRKRWRAGTKAVPVPWFANVAAPQLLAVERCGCKLTLIQARLFDLIAKPVPAAHPPPNCTASFISAMRVRAASLPSFG